MADFVNPNNDIEVVSPPGKTVSAMEFSPATMQKTFFVAGGWDKSVRRSYKRRTMKQVEII